MGTETTSYETPLTLIATHINANFDAVASLLCAQKLYPDAYVVLPDKGEKNIRSFFIASMTHLFQPAPPELLTRAPIDRLVLVDSRQPERLRQIQPVLARCTPDIHIYDHHPASPDDLSGSLEVVSKTGATTTLMVEIIRQQEIPLSPEEATVMCLGIHEDTGSFLFSSTTERDFAAAGFLVGLGADLNTISSLTAREMSPFQVSVLNDMIQTATTHRINGVDIVFSRIVSDRYINDLSFLTHKMVRMENLDAIFIIAQMENKITLIGRSRLPEVDVGAILACIGGGGHPYAASASVRDKTLAQVEEELLSLLAVHVQTTKNVRAIMSTPPIHTRGDTSCKAAAELLNRYNINALLITDALDADPPLQGYITRQVIEKALYHDLGTVAVREYMNTEWVWAEPDSDLMEIQAKIMDHKQRILPIIENQTIIGVVTRTDLLNLLIHQNIDRQQADRSDMPKTDSIHGRKKKIIHLIRQRIQEDRIRLLESAGQIGDSLGYGIYVVGGFVRDLLLCKKNDDIDIVVEGDGIVFAKTFAETLQARVHTYEKFGTAVVKLDSGYKIDIATARMEYYQMPAALPIVEMSSIKLDLFRRDFTINTLAIQLNTGQFGTLIDFFSGRRDLKDKAIRIIHNMSFVEDPTRVFRAIRFEQRFGFTIGKLTRRLIDNAIKMDFFKRLSGNRVFTELRLILEEENPIPALLRLDEFGLLDIIQPGLKLDPKLQAHLEACKKVIAWHELLFVENGIDKWAIYLMALLRYVDGKTTREICTRFNLPPRYGKWLSRDRFRAMNTLYWLNHHLPADNATIYRKLEYFPTEVLLFLMAFTTHETIKKTVSDYYTRLRHIRLSIRGKDLQKMGIPAGPVYRTLMDATLDAKLNGQLPTPADEMAYARACYQAITAANA